MSRIGRFFSFISRLITSALALAVLGPLFFTGAEPDDDNDPKGPAN